MTIVKGDPSYIDNKDKFFIDVAKVIEQGSNHPFYPGGCVIVRDREIIGDGRSCLAHCRVEIDCISYAIGVASKRGTPLAGATVYSTRWPFSSSVFQLHLMGVKKIIVLVRGEWEAHYKEEYRRSGRLGTELQMKIIPYYEDPDQRFTNTKTPTVDSFLNGKQLLGNSANPIEHKDFNIDELLIDDHESNFTL